MFNEETYKQKFKDHIATLQNLNNITVLDFKRPNSNEYRIRFLFEEDYCRLHISGDLGELTAVNYNNMVYENFSDFVNSIGYFKEKITSHSRPLYYYDEDSARQELKEKFEDYFYEADLDDKIDEILEDFSDENGISQDGYNILSEMDYDAWEYAGDIGKKNTDILYVYMLAFKLAKEQLNSKEK